MNYASLILAALLGTPAIVMLLHHKARRTAALLAGLAAMCLLAGVPAFMAYLGHPIGAGPILVGVVILFVGAATFFYLDIIRGGHKDALMGRKGEGHHLRPLASCLVLAVAGLVIAINFSAVEQGISGGFGQTVTSITHRGA